jgi:hypothetical protein
LRAYGDLNAVISEGRSPMTLFDLSWVVSLCLLALVGSCSESLRTFLDVHLTSWSLRLQGVPPEEIHKIAIAKATRQRRNVLLQVLRLLITLRKK